MDYPKIPAQEYRERWAKVQRLMEEQNLDALVTYSDDHATYGAAYARWLANFPAHFEPVLVLFFREGGPKLLVGPETPGYAAMQSEIKDICVLKEFTHPDEDYLFTEIHALRDIVGGTKVKRLGVAGLDIMGVPIYKALCAAFSDTEMLDVSTPLTLLRAIKTPAEIAVIKFAYRIAELGINAAIEAIEPGVTERAVAAAAEAAMRRAYSEGTGIDTIVASGQNGIPILARTTTRKIEDNDLVTITVAPRYEGYHGAIARPVIVGQPTEELQRSVALEAEAQNAVAEALIAGKPGREAEAVGRSIMGKAGYDKYFLYSGIHSVGVIEFEAPIFGPSSDDILAPGMVVSVDIPLYEAPFPGSRTENGYLVHENGVEKLNDTPLLIRK